MSKRTLPKKERMDKAKSWVKSYNGSKILQAYKKKFCVATLTALDELRELGHQFTPEYIQAVKVGEEARLKKLREEKEERLYESNSHQNDMFFFIAGYTSGGAPYGVTWDEMGLEPWEDIYGIEAGAEIDAISADNRKSSSKHQGNVEKAGKNHIKVNGQLLQTNKKWSALKEKQKTWIYETAKTEYDKFLEENNRLPRKSGKERLIMAIEERVRERGIWLPPHEMERGIAKFIDRQNRKNYKSFQTDQGE